MTYEPLDPASHTPAEEVGTAGRTTLAFGGRSAEHSRRFRTVARPV